MVTEAFVSREAVRTDGGPRSQDLTIWIYLLFFTSGIPAIIYQIVWQRALFALYGINIESVTIVISAFMLGLGLGSLGGGILSRSSRLPLVALFGAAELGTAIFGLASLQLFHYVAEHTLTQPLWVTGAISFLLVIVPTTLMGSTLPLLIEHLVRTNGNVGGSVGALYFVNTLGSGAACIVAIRPLMSNFGQLGTVRCAVLINGLVGVGALFYSIHCEQTRHRDDAVVEDESYSANASRLPFGLAMLCAGFCGFVALSYEIVWYRLLAFASEDRAPIFISLLGSYLVGLALGARFAEGYAERNSGAAAIPVLALTILASAMLSFWVSPVAALVLRFLSPVRADGGWLSSFLFLFLVCHAAILFGALFPLIAHVSVGSKRAGTAVSYLYAANIAGSTFGVLVVGFILMDRLSLYQIAWVLLAGGILCALAVFYVGHRVSKTWKLVFALACLASLLIVPFSRPVFYTIYDRLLFKGAYPAVHFSEVIENRSGTIGVTLDGMVFGGGVYDGYFNTDLQNDKNMVIRAYALSAFQAAPSRVLMIGLGSGSWSQVIANNPQVRDLTIVEINPGYLDAIRKHAETASILHNPKITIIIDDGRRWLRRNPKAKFDLVVMNTTFYWRNHSSNLLSTDFLQIVRSHLNPNGVFFYNTTASDDVVATGATVYPYTLRVLNCVALSNSPLTFDRAKWRSVLLEYVIDGKHVIDANDPEQIKKLDQIVNIPDVATGIKWNSIGNDAEIRRELKRRKNLIITDDNMGLEWR